MTTNRINNVEETDISDCDGEKVVTMMDVLQEQQEFEEDANAVLGASDDKECTYSKGYIKRQAIYACLTCCSEAKDDPTRRAGVCLACSLNCHENHELVELYTKRNFRCDCGNAKFNSHPCQFTPNKTELNEDNFYNQNFSGLYCICNRPYPDPEATVEEEMTQCIICEDWLHSNHLDAVVPANDLYAEMICKLCMDNNEFLHDYSQLAVNYEVDVDVIAVTGIGNHKGGNTENTSVCNEKMDTSDITDVNIENDKQRQENVESQVRSCIFLNEDNEAMTEDAKITEIEIKNGTETSEKPLLEESITTVSMDTDITNTIESEHIKSDKPVILETKDIHDKIDLKNTESNISLTNTPDSEQNDDVSKELLNPKSEQIEGITEPTEEVFKSTEDLVQQDNSLEDDKNNSESTCDESVEMSKPSDNESKEDNNEENTMLPVIDEDKSYPSKPTDTIFNEGLGNTDTKEFPKQTNDCEVDSLEAATKELSELMANEVENNQANIDSKINKLLEVPTEQIPSESTANENGLSQKINDDSHKNTMENDSVHNNTENDYKRKLNDINEGVSVKKQKLDKNESCLRPRGVKRILNGAAFWPSNFRQKLCTCNDCLSMYKDLNVLFLTDPEDTVTAYETLGKERNNGGPATQYEKGLEALSSLDRVQQINALTEYNRMRDKLLDFLKSFKDRKEIVKEEDIKAFFAGMKPRREPDGVYFCR